MSLQLRHRYEVASSDAGVAHRASQRQYDVAGSSVHPPYPRRHVALPRRSGTVRNPRLPPRRVVRSRGSAPPRERARLYDALGHPTTVTDSAGTTLATYSYDDLARRAQVQYNGTTGAKMLYSWSSENDLLTLSSDFAGSASDVSYTHTFSPAHQWLTATVSNAAFRYLPAAAASVSYGAANALNQYPTLNGAAVAYDARGNYRGGGAAPFAYDAQNRLMTSTNGVVYAYDPLGRRTRFWN